MKQAAGNREKRRGTIAYCLLPALQEVPLADHKQFYIQGLTHLAKGNLDEALASFQQAVEIKADFLEGHLAVGQAYERKGMLDEAVAAVRKAIEIDPKDPLVHTSLSRLFQQKGMIPEAEEEMALSRQLQAGL